MVRPLVEYRSHPRTRSKVLHSMHPAHYTFSTSYTIHNQLQPRPPIHAQYNTVTYNLVSCQVHLCCSIRNTHVRQTQRPPSPRPTIQNNCEFRLHQTSPHHPTRSVCRLQQLPTLHPPTPLVPHAHSIHRREYANGAIQFTYEIQLNR